MDGVTITRYRYAPKAWELLVNDGGIMANIRRQKWAIMLVPGFLIAQILAIRRLLVEFGPDAVHAHWIIPQGLAWRLAARRRRAPPVLMTSHGADLFALKGRAWQWLKQWVLQGADKLTVVSEPMRALLARTCRIPLDVEVEPMGIDLTLFHPSAEVPRSNTDVLFVGRLVEKKGLKHLIDAMAILVVQHPGARLIIAGFGPEEAARREQVQRLGIEANVTFLGSVANDRLPDLYRRAAVFAAPFVEASNGDQEGLGLVTYEALACGCPVVISEIAATRQLEQGPGIRKTPPADAGALAAAITAQLVGGETPSTMEANSLDWEERARAYGAILKSISSPKRRSQASAPSKSRKDA
jgi:glycosyltransferase involved in cell wall biosynthesis